jgi:squalene-hopene/tetraprenyl-beta-curcumene cyclase
MRLVARLGLGAVILGAGAIGACKGGLLGTKTAEPVSLSQPSLARVAIAACDPAGKATIATAMTDDTRVRGAAQKGLGFVAKDAVAWQTEHNCYGCHVQAVTLEALVVGKKNRYDVPQSDLDAMLHGMFDIPGGAHQKVGLEVGVSGGIPVPSKAFGGAAFAHYDQAIDARARKELLQTAKELVALQAQDGHLEGYDRPPVSFGSLQQTTQALQTWRQAYERTADDQWLAPMRRAEQWIQTETRKLTDTNDAATTQLGYAIIGILSAGGSRSEATVQSLAKKLVSLQAESGAWSGKTAEGGSVGPSAIATGTALYALRLVGMNDHDPVIARGAKWLMDNQHENGGWSQSGAARAEAMWAVLGLVTVDVLSVELAGVLDGAHVDGSSKIQAVARDNDGGAVKRVDLAIDDITVKSTCGDRLDFPLDASQLGDGAHTIDVLATNARGQTTRRRVQVYAGAHYLTEVGTRFEDDGTAVSARDIAPDNVKRQLELHVFATRLDDGAHVKDKEVWKTTRDGAQGPVRFFWNGKDEAGKSFPRGSYVAELRFVRPDGSVVQKIETPFVHDSAEVQQQKFGEVEGALKADGDLAIANADVELLDKNGNVVQKVQSTAQGNYRFRNVDSGDYKVRVTKRGFVSKEAAVKAAPATAAPAPIDLHAK